MEIDVAQVAAATVTVLAPFMPILLETAKFSAAAIGEMVVQKGGEAAWNKAKAIWGKIKPYYGDDGVITGAATMVAAEPENEGLQKILVTTLAERLQQNPELAQELLVLLGGQDSVQKVIADRKSLVKKVRQEMSGSGSQIVEARDKSKIVGVKQTKK